MNFDEQVQAVNQQMYTAPQRDPRLLAMAVEINQRFIEYLEEVKKHISFCDEGVTVDVDGQRIHFQNRDDFASWLAESLQ